jgi:hypothetical protein
MGGGDYKRRGKISYLGDVRTVKWCTRKRKGETWGKGRERKQVDNDRFNQISTTNKTFPRIPNHFTIHAFHDLPTFQRKTQLSLPCSDVRGCLSMTERGRLVWDGFFSAFEGRGISTGHRSPRLKRVWVVWKQRFELENREGEHRRERTRRRVTLSTAATKDGREREMKEGGIQDNSIGVPRSDFLHIGRVNAACG